MKVNYKANGIEFLINNESMFVHVDQMYSDLPITKARIDKFCDEQAIEEHTSFNDVMNRFHDYLHNIFLYTIPTLLFKFLIDKDLAHIIKP